MIDQNPWGDVEPRYTEIYRTVMGSRLSNSDKLSIRARIAGYFSLAVPTSEALDAIAGLSPLIEVGAGSGYWARLLHDLGADMVAIDRAPPDDVWTEVLRADESALAHIADRTLFLCWPFRPGAGAILHAFTGHTAALITDGPAFGDRRRDSLYRLLDQSWRLIQIIPIPTWPAVADILRIYRRAF